MNQGFSYYFCMMIEGSGSGSRAGSGSIPLTSGFGSGSWRPKNTWIRWIRIRIRIRNTASNSRNLLRISTVQLMHTVKEKVGNLIENHTPSLSFKKSIQNLISENSQDYAYKPQRNCTFMNSASSFIHVLSSCRSAHLIIISYLFFPLLKDPALGHSSP
jgi:hypothetical protein